MTDDSTPPGEAAEAQLERVEWSAIRQPGCYLHLASGLLARIYAEDLTGEGAPRVAPGGGPTVRLAANPGAPLAVLRQIAERHGLRLES